MNTHRTPWQERFWRYVEPVEHGCWEWQGSCDNKGYGRLQRGGKNGGHIKAHRASWEIHRGPIPEGHGVLHKCDNPPCVRPDHLFTGTQKINSQDMVRKGRCGSRPGRFNGRTSVPDETIRAIRLRAAEGCLSSTLARDYGLRVQYVAAILTGERRSAAGGPIQLVDNRSGTLMALLLERLRAADRPLTANELLPERQHDACVRACLRRLERAGDVGVIESLVRGRHGAHRWFLKEGA